MRWRAIFVALTICLTVTVWATPASAETIREMEWHLGAVHAIEAQKVTRGAGVIVAVVDSGVDAGHPDLAGAVLPGASFLGSTSQAGQTDPIGHGTRMSGLIAARGGGANQALGIAPGARILPVAVSVDTVAGSMAESIRWAVDHGAKVINLSVARALASPLPAGEAEAIAYAQAKDVVVVVASGNRVDFATGNALAKLPGVVAVSGLTRSGSFWSGGVSADYVAISAPSENVVNIGARNVHSTGYTVASGTSDGTAIVSGVAALIRAKFPNLDAANAINRLIRSAVDKGPPGRDPMYGFGAVDAQHALTLDIPSVTANPLGVASTPTPTATAIEAGAGGQGGTPTTALAIVAGALLCVLIGAVALGVVIWLVVRSRRPKPTWAAPAGVGQPMPHPPYPPHPQYPPYPPYRPYPPGPPPPQTAPPQTAPPQTPTPQTPAPGHERNY